MLIKSILAFCVSIVFSPLLISSLPQQKVQIIEFLQSEVEQIEMPEIELPFVPQSLRKGEDMTLFHIRYIRPNLADFNPIRSIERKK